MRDALVVLTLLVLLGEARAQERYLIEFCDKGPETRLFVPGSPLYESASARLSQHAIARRLRGRAVSSTTAIITIEDAEVYSEYLDSLCGIGVVPQHVLRWSNSVSCNLSSEQREQVERWSFVTGVRKLACGAPTGVPKPVTSGVAPLKVASPSTLSSPCAYDQIIFRYGGAHAQLNRTNVAPLHALGLDATGVRIGFLDTGFRWKAVDALKSRFIAKERDFVFGDDVTANEDIDVPNQDGHGTHVLSSAVGFMPDSLIGAAYGAQIYLAKTEDLRSETTQEEDNYAAALEWMEAEGVDITSSSLGYFDFDDTSTNYTFEDLNGETTISARAARRAADLGMLVFTAMGNSGKTEFPKLNTPADADKIIAVGALDELEQKADFSSFGPTSDGRIKPEIAAPGVNVWSVSPTNVFGPATGTSFSTPIASSAAAVVWQAHPEASAQEVRAALLASSSQANNPDTLLGFGRLNAYAAALELGTVIGPPHWSFGGVPEICIGAAAKQPIKRVRMWYQVSGESGISKSLDLRPGLDSNLYVGKLPAGYSGKLINYAIEVVNADDTSTWSPRNPRSFSVRLAPSPILLPVFPNPASDQVSVELPVEILESDRLVVYDQAGRMVLQLPLTANATVVSIATKGLASGVYSLDLMSGEGEQKSTGRLVIVHE